MADFSADSTQLPLPQGRGANPVAPVSVQPVNTMPMNLISTIGDVFAKGLAQGLKDQAEERKRAVLGEYTQSEQTYSDALSTGQWNAGQATAASRAKFMQLIAAYPEYTQELTQARSAVYGGTEIGQAEKQKEFERKLREEDILSASKAGFTFFEGQDEKSINLTIDAHKTSVRVQDQLRQYRDQANEDRAARADQRAEETHQMSTRDYYVKQQAVKGVLEVADKNFDLFAHNVDSYYKKVADGSMTYEQAAIALDQDTKRIQFAIQSYAAYNPDIAGPWNKLFGEMTDVASKLIDPAKRTENEAKMLRDKFNALVDSQKILAVSNDPDVMHMVVASELFKGQPLVGLAETPTVKRFLENSLGPNSKGPIPQVVGTGEDGKLFKATQDALNKIQTNKIDLDKKDQVTSEAIRTVNNLLSNTSTVDNRVAPKDLKSASTFYASTEFGKFAMDHGIDKETASNVQKVFQLQYDPVVKEAIMTKLDQNTPLRLGDGKDVKLSEVVEPRLMGGRVVFQAVPVDTSKLGFTTSPAWGIERVQKEAKKSLSEAESGLNQLIRMHAHLEGTTDYGKYWEAHKHELMPAIYPDPAKLKPGQVITAKNGKKYKYLGGNYNNIRANYEEVADGGS